MEYTQGQEVIAFDVRQWLKGSVDFAENKHCWKPGIVAKVRKYYRSGYGLVYPLLYDVQFADGYVSENHSPTAIKPKLANAI
jgi:hypothetical protein